MRYQLIKTKPEIAGEIQLPASKSISNRLLILNSLASRKGEIYNLSDSDDTRILQAALSSKHEEIDAGHAGTAMRFLTAYLSIGRGERILTGSDRMQNRPIGQLVDALKRSGAEISYMNREGYPPLRIKGKKISGGQITIDSSISSQFVSALMMIGPSLENGLIIHLKNEMVSSSYIRLTMNLMKDYGIQVDFTGNTIRIPYKIYTGIDHTVEADWSAASYWYAMAALSEHTELKLLGLRQESYQGDAVLPGLFRQFGVNTRFLRDGIILIRERPSGTDINFDFRENPDLVQTMAVLCGLTGRPFYFTGTRTLQIKETDRILALDNELQKLGIHISYDPEGNWISWDGKKRSIPSTQFSINTYQDHRMAMAFAPASIQIPELTIEDPDVVSKSYPAFWMDMEHAGFQINKI